MLAILLATSLAIAALPAGAAARAFADARAGRAGEAMLEGETARSVAGVPDPQRAWQNWTLNCQGCHRADGSGSANTSPSLAGTVAKFLSVTGGREYLGRVPGVATSPLSDVALAELMNWMLWRFDQQHLPNDYVPYTAEEIGRLRLNPLRLEANEMRAELLRKADQNLDVR